jgi:hypothetical protein
MVVVGSSDITSDGGMRILTIEIFIDLGTHEIMDCEDPKLRESRSGRRILWNTEDMIKYMLKS